jgi:hypothetical protein
LEKNEVYTNIWCGNLKKGDHKEEVDVDGRIALKWVLKK